MRKSILVQGLVLVAACALVVTGLLGTIKNLTASSITVTDRTKFIWLGSGPKARWALGADRDTGRVFLKSDGGSGDIKWERLKKEEDNCGDCFVLVSLGSPDSSKYKVMAGNQQDGAVNLYPGDVPGHGERFHIMPVPDSVNRFVLKSAGVDPNSKGYLYLAADGDSGTVSLSTSINSNTYWQYADAGSDKPAPPPETRCEDIDPTTRSLIPACYGAKTCGLNQCSCGDPKRGITCRDNSNHQSCYVICK